MNDHANRRNFSRVEPHIDVEVDCDDKIVCGRLADVSLRGIRLVCDEKLPLQAEGMVKLLLGEEKKDSVYIKAKGKIIRAVEDGICIEFMEIDLDSFGHLRNLVQLNASNVPRVESEFKSHLGLKKPLAK